MINVPDSGLKVARISRSLSEDIKSLQMSIYSPYLCDFNVVIKSPPYLMPQVKPIKLV